jgi:hypothetical protein
MRENKTFKKSPARSPSRDHINSLTQGTAVDSDEEDMNDNGMDYDNDYPEEYHGAEEDLITISRKRGRSPEKTSTSDDLSYADTIPLIIPKKKSSNNSSSSRDNKNSSSSRDNKENDSSRSRNVPVSMDIEENNEPLLIAKRDDSPDSDDEHCAVDVLGNKVKLTSKKRVVSVAAKPREKEGYLRRIKWAAEEDEALIQGLHKYQTTAWAKILRDISFASALALRRSTDLKDRYKVLKKKGLYDIDWEKFEGRKKQTNGVGEK